MRFEHYTELLQTHAFTHRHFYTQTLCAQTLLHTGTFTHRRFLQRQFLPIEPYFVHKGCARHLHTVILRQIWTIELHFVRKGCISWRLVGTAPCLQGNRKEGEEEGTRARVQECKRARAQEGKRAREQEGKRARGQEKM